MIQQETQPDSTGQEAENTPVANKLGLLDERSLSDLLKSNFLDEKEEAAPAIEEKEEPEAEVQEPEQEPVAEAEEESDQPIEEDEADESHVSKGVQKRINKLVAAKKNAQAELEAHKAELSAAKRELEQLKNSTPVRQPDVSDAIQKLSTLEQVQEERQKAVDVYLWCEDNPDGGIIQLPDGTEKELTSAEVRAMKKLAYKRKEVELPAREAYLSQQAHIEAEIVKDFAWYSKPETEEYQLAQQVLREFPELKLRRPDHKHIAGLVVLGIKAYNDMKAKKKPSLPIKRAPAQPSATVAPAKTAHTDVQKAKQAFARSTSRDGLTDLVKAIGFV